jgi:hypothetical protein
VSEEARRRAAKMPELAQRMREAHIDMGRDDLGGVNFVEFEDQSKANFVKALIVLEEFCKELFSTLTAKARFVAVKKTVRSSIPESACVHVHARTHHPHTTEGTRSACRPLPTCTHIRPCSCKQFTCAHSWLSGFHASLCIQLMLPKD